MSSNPRLPKAVEGRAGDPFTMYAHTPALADGMKAIYAVALADPGAVRENELLRMRTARRINCFS